MKLNKKGFTLIELLAVIVILAIILVIAMPMALDAMNSSRISSLHSSAKGVANWYAEAAVADALVDEEYQAIPDEVYANVGNTWKCMESLSGQLGTSGPTINLFQAAGLSASDIVGGTTAPTVDASGNLVVTSSTCAAIKVNNTGAPEIVLVAKDGGKFFINGKTTYAYSVDDNGVSK